ncbi:hypothetical protein Glove_359g26 [Diversispora epigaea]|uniref:ABC transmembrane type-1 domain-containing protein n=1 Tax=Diversispora epigaea TaxID=1348612 RepID=A0A397HEN9_9GLOM|nr:hypothetical protein Glove_359g26 [Diversispora epigaea]
MFEGDSFCHDPAGWGPLEPARGGFNMTLCFTEGTLIIPINALMMIFGSLEIFYLVKRSTVVPANGLRKWNFVFKRIALISLIVLSIIYLGFSLSYNNWNIKDLFILSAAINVITLIFIKVLQKKSYLKSNSVSSILILYWILYLGTNSIKLRTWINRNYRREQTLLFYTLLSSIIFAFISLVLELIPKPRDPYELIEEDSQTSPEETANIFSRLTFYWMTPMMKLGYKKYLTFADLMNLNSEDQSKRISEKFEEKWKNELTKKNPSLIKVISLTFGGPFIFAALFKFLQDMLNFVQPQLLKMLMIFVRSQGEENPQPALWGYYIAVMMFFIAILQTMFLHQYFQFCFVTGMRTRAGLVTAIYQKSLLLSNSGRQSSTVGEIVNHMSVDTQKIMDLTTYFHITWSGPFQIILALYFLYQTMGVSVFAGVAVMILMTPVNAVLASKMRTLQKKQMTNKDDRIKLMNEILNGIKVIKLYAWESAFTKKISHIRNNLELNTLKKLGYLASIQSFTWASTPFLVSFATFAVYVTISDEPLTSEIVFVALTLFNLLQFPLTVFPLVITSAIEAVVALKRVQDFLKADELDPKAIIRLPYRSVDNNEVPKKVNGRTEMVLIKNGTFKWNKGGVSELEGIDLSVVKGNLISIVGRVGAGKSSLLSAVLGEMYKVDGQVVVRGHVAYVPQSGKNK